MNGASSGLTNGDQMTFQQLETKRQIAENEEALKFNLSIRLSANNSQLKHIFRNAPGHLIDTPENRQLLLSLAQDQSKYVGCDKYGNSWNVEITNSGKQLWVRYRNDVINEGGMNETIKSWDNETGLNNNPFKSRKEVQ